MNLLSTCMFRCGLRQRQLARDLRKRHEERVCRRQSRRRKCWKNRPLHRRSCPTASDHRAGCHVRDSIAPSRHCQSGLRLGRRGQRYTHAFFNETARKDEFYCREKRIKNRFTNLYSIVEVFMELCGGIELDSATPRKRPTRTLMLPRGAQPINQLWIALIFQTRDIANGAIHGIVDCLLMRSAYAQWNQDMPPH